MKTKAEQLINDLYVTFQNDNTLKQVRINIVLQFARETAEKAYPEMPGWGFKNFDEYWNNLTSPNTGDKNKQE